MTESALKGLKPTALWKYFDAICKIPHGSKNEAALAQYVMDVAKGLGLDALKDPVGNVVVRKAASKGKEGAPGVIVQGHLDMVCEKNKDKQYDFTKEPIRTKVKDGWLMADGTTLGADNGIAVAAALALMEDKKAIHGPLEFFFTIEEEAGMKGVKEMSRDLLKGRIMLNLDSEEIGQVYIGCAGSADTYTSFEPRLEAAPAGSVPLYLQVRGCRGGHSGCDIHEGRANAIKLLTRALYLLHEGAEARVSTLEGGNKRNALPREAEAVVYVPAAQKAKALETVARLERDLQVEYKGREPNLALKASAEGAKATGQVFAKADQERLLRLLYLAPHGVLQMSAAIPGLVETSTNLGVVTFEKGKVQTICMTRSSVESAKADWCAVHKVLGAALGCKVEQDTGYPGWNPNLDSKALKVCQKVWKAKFRKDPQVKAIHAGLECAIVQGKVPDMDMVSFGPTIVGPHSPDEKCEIATVAKFFDYTKLVLKALAE